MKEKASFFTSIMNEFYAMQDFDQAKAYITSYVKDSSINPTSKHTILIRISQIYNLTELQKYVTNSMLKYMGMGL